MSMMPDKIALASAEALKATPLLDAALSAGTPGEIVVACDPERSWGQRLVIVLASNADTMTVDILLVTTDTEMASDLDLILVPEESGVPFPLMVESELYGPLFVEQLISTLGRLSKEHRAAAASALTTDGESLDEFATGTPLGPADDPRRGFKSEELRDLEKLVGECRRWLMGGAAESQILDPGLLLPPPAGTARETAIDRYLELLDVLAAGGGELRELPRELVSIIGEAALIEEIARWWTDFRCDVHSILSRFRFFEAGVNTSDLDPVDPDDPLVSYLQLIAMTGMRIVDVHSSQARWRRDLDVLVIESKSGTCRARAVLKKVA